MPEASAFVPMPKERQQEIALMYLKHKMRGDGIKVRDVKRRVSAEAQEIGLDPDEAMHFVETITRDLVDEAFKK